MAYTSTGINSSAVIVAPAGSTLVGAPTTDVRGKAIKFDASGKAEVASTAGEKVMGIALITEGETIADSGNEVNIQVKDIGLARVSGSAIATGDELTAAADGTLQKAADGNFVIATALEAWTEGATFIRVQLTKYQKPAAQTE